jgi:hypothetical protein
MGGVGARTGDVSAPDAEASKAINPAKARARGFTIIRGSKGVVKV